MRAGISFHQQRRQFAGAATVVAHAFFQHGEQRALHARRGVGDVAEDQRGVGDRIAQALLDLVRLDVGSDVEISAVPAGPFIRMAGREGVGRLKAANAAQVLKPGNEGLVHAHMISQNLRGGASRNLAQADQWTVRALRYVTGRQGWGGQWWRLY